MNQYKITAPVTLHEGIVCLSKEQIKGREHKLQLIKGRKDCYQITAPNQFKAGQEIGYEGELPKMVAVNLTSSAEEEKAAKAAAKAAKEAEKAAAKEAEKAAAKEAEEAAAKEAEEAAKARTKQDADAKVVWDADANLREQYGNDFNAFLAEVLEPQH